MKKSLVLLVAFFAAFGCSKETATQIPAVSNSLSITAGAETKAWLDASGASPVIKWRNTDVLVVFDSNLTGVEFTTTASNSTTATFITDKWTGKAPHYAAAYCPNYGEARSLTAPAEGVMSVKFRAAQVLDNLKSSGFMSSACVGKVEEQDGDYVISQMKNVMGFIGFSFAGTNVRSIEITANGGNEKLAGWVDVDYAKLIAGEAAFWTPTQDKTQEDKITLTPASNAKAASGDFKPGTYYAALLPQTYAKGLKITLLDAGKNVVAERTVGASSGVTIKRSDITPMKGNLDVIPIKLPDTVVIDLYFGSGTNPLGFASPGLANESANGDTYDYTYSYDDPDTKEPKTITFPVVVCRGTPEDGSFGYRFLKTTGTSYGNGSPVVQFHKCLNGWIKAPVLEDYYLQTISLSHGNTDASLHMRIKEDPAKSSIAQMTLTKGGTSAPATMTVHFYTDGNDCNNTSMNSNTTSISTAYYMIFAEKNQVIDRLTFTYTKTLPTR